MTNFLEAAQNPRPAATVMLVRDGPVGIEVYLTRRSTRSSFVPDAFVFPGGAVDPGDRSPEIAARLNARIAAPELAVAAIRELFEEAGILLAVTCAGEPPGVDDAWRDRARRKLIDGVPFHAVMSESGLLLDVANVHPYSNWITPLEEPKRFDTHFFAARLPPGQTAQDDAREVHDGAWFTPADALRRASAHEITIIFPTRKHLERIGAFADAQAFLDNAKTRVYSPVLAVSLGASEFGLPDGIGEW